MSSERAQALASQFDTANKEMIATIEGLSEEQWRTRMADEGRPVAVVAHHVAGALRAVAGWVRTVASGQPLPPELTHEFIDQTNAVHAQKHAEPSKDEVLDLLRRNGQATETMIRGLSDEELDRTTDSPFFADHPVPTRSVIKHVLIAHITNHLKDIRATLGL